MKHRAALFYWSKPHFEIRSRDAQPILSSGEQHVRGAFLETLHTCRRRKAWFLLPIASRMFVAAVLYAAPGVAPAGDPVVTNDKVITDDRRMAILQWKLASLQKEVELLEDVKAIERLQQAYGYYVSEGMGSEAAALFSDSPTASIEMAQQGVYLGKDRIRAYLTHGGEGLKEGEIRETPLMQGIVHVAPDGKTAKARWRTLTMAGTYGQDGQWIEGPFENEYIKEGGVWKFSKIHWYTTVIGSYDEGWHKKSYPAPGPLADLPPDLPPTDKYAAFPAYYLPPYHYLHPVTQKPVSWE